MKRRTLLRLGGAAAVGASLATVGLADPADAQAELALSVDGTERELGVEEAINATKYGSVGGSGQLRIEIA